MVNNWEEPSSVYAPQLKLLRIVGIIPASSGQINGTRRRLRWLKKLSIGNVIFVVKVFNTFIHILKFFFCILYSIENWSIYVLDFIVSIGSDGTYAYFQIHCNEVKCLHGMLGQFPQRNTKLKTFLRWIPFAVTVTFALLTSFVIYSIVSIPGELQRYYNFSIFPVDVTHRPNLYAALAVVDVVIVRAITYFSSTCAAILLATQVSHWVASAHDFRDELRSQLGSRVSAPYLKYATHCLSKMILSLSYFSHLYSSGFAGAYFMGVCCLGALVNMTDHLNEGIVLASSCVIVFVFLAATLIITTMMVFLYDNKSVYSPLIVYQLIEGHSTRETELAIQAEILAQLFPHLKDNVTVGGFFFLDRAGMLQIWSGFFTILTFVIENKPILNNALLEMGTERSRDFYIPD